MGSARQQPLDDGFSSVIALPPYRNYGLRTARREKADPCLTVSALQGHRKNRSWGSSHFWEAFVMFSRLSGIVVTLLAFLACSCIAFGQVTTGTILGTARDSTGAVVPSATVTITDTGKGTVSTYTTDANGDYNAPFLNPGTYNVAVQKTGFKQDVSNNVVLDVDQHARVDFAMQVGQATETVEVISAAPLVRLDSAELGEVVGKTQVQDLPLNGRNFAQLVYLVPGVT